MKSLRTVLLKVKFAEQHWNQTDAKYRVQHAQFRKSVKQLSFVQLRTHSAFQLNEARQPRAISFSKSILRPPGASGGDFDRLLLNDATEVLVQSRSHVDRNVVMLDLYECEGVFLADWMLFEVKNETWIVPPFNVPPQLY